nr:MAG TPA: hypothetical protein [Caudoviricetes sp.]
MKLLAFVPQQKLHIVNSLTIRHYFGPLPQ